MKRFLSYIRQELNNGFLEYALVLAFVAIVIIVVMDILDMTIKNQGSLVSISSSLAENHKTPTP
ncbi:MAG TPA: hypothetical protein VNJ29_00860 [Candidatus Nitrosotenuis sp.]|nr:hypothetical protein [Candidatus Nitrosotenuis sp.]